MRRGRIFFYLALILLLGLVAVVVVWQRYLGPASKPKTQVTVVTPVVNVVNVLVVSQHVPRGSVITRDVLSMVPIQRELFIQGMFSNINEVEGKLAKFDLDAGIPLTKSMLADSAETLSGTGSLAALSIPRGMVAVSLPLSRLSNSYPLKSGDHVNVIVSVKFVDIDTDFQTVLPNQAALVIAPGVASQGGDNYLTVRVGEGGVSKLPTVGKTETIPGLGQTVYSVPSETQRPRLVSQSLLQNAVVLNVGNYATYLGGKEANIPIEQTPEQPPQGQQTPTPLPPGPDFLSLVVAPQDAVTLNYLLSSGAQLTLVLRAADDDTRVQIEAVTLQYLLTQYNIPVPVRLPYSLQPRIDEVAAPSFTTKPQPTPTP